MLYVARTAQGFAASVIWIVGSATLADTVGADNMGKTLGAISIFTTAGQFAGPMVGGLLLETAGYWAAWFTAVGIVRFYCWSLNCAIGLLSDVISIASR